MYVALWVYIIECMFAEHERDRYIRAGVTGSGRRLRISILEQEVANVVVELKEQIWYHLCQSWDTNTGRWQAYLDGRLVGDGVNAAVRSIPPSINTTQFNYLQTKPKHCNIFHSAN